MNTRPPEQIRDIARGQRLLIAAIGCNLLLTICSIPLSALVDPQNPGSIQVKLSTGLLLLSLVVLVVQMIATYRLAKALGSSVAWLWTVAMIVPCLSLVLLLVLNHQATTAVRAAGIRVGLLGAGAEEVERVLAAIPPPSSPDLPPPTA